jgi:hypothetical protein
METIEKPDEITIDTASVPEAEVGDAVEGLLGAYNTLGFERGYARANQYLIATLPLLIEQFDREYVGITSRDREVLKLFGRFLEEKLATY